MNFCTKLPNFIHIGPPNAEIWRHIDFSTWQARLLNCSFGFLFVNATVFGRAKSTSKPISSTGLNITYISATNWDLSTNYFRWEKQTTDIVEFYSRFRFRLCPTIGMLFCIRLPNFIQIGFLFTAETWRHVDFSRWRPRRLSTISGFLLVDATVFGRLISISKPNFVDISQLIFLWPIYNYFRFGKNKRSP